MDKLELAERVEAATGPDRDIDSDIAIALDIVPGGTIRGKGVNRNNWSGDRGDYWTPPSFTASLDAALTLVPEGYNWGVWRRHDWRLQNAQVWSHEIEGSTTHGNAATPALALCAAALRARAEGGKS